MDRHNLRPIGAEFDYCFPPSEGDSSPAFNVIRYKVVAHDEVQPRPGTTEIAERIDPVDIQRYPVKEYRLLCGELKPVPPAECARLLDQSWQPLISETNDDR